MIRDLLLLASLVLVANTALAFSYESRVVEIHSGYLDQRSLRMQDGGEHWAVSDVRLYRVMVEGQVLLSAELFYQRQGADACSYDVIPLHAQGWDWPTTLSSLRAQVEGGLQIEQSFRYSKLAETSMNRCQVGDFPNGFVRLVGITERAASELLQQLPKFTDPKPPDAPSVDPTDYQKMLFQRWRAGGKTTVVEIRHLAENKVRITLQRSAQAADFDSTFALDVDPTAQRILVIGAE